MFRANRVPAAHIKNNQTYPVFSPHAPCNGPITANGDVNKETVKSTAHKYEKWRENFMYFYTNKVSFHFLKRVASFLAF